MTGCVSTWKRPSCCCGDGAAPLSLGVAVGGAVWSWAYRRSGSLLGPWLSHILVDTGIMLIGYDLLRGLHGARLGNGLRHPAARMR